MIRVLPFFIELALLIYCLIDAIQSPEIEIRNLPKWGWILLIVILPLVGSVAWLVAGRPVRQPTTGWRPGGGFPEYERPPARTQDIDARLESDLARVDREHEEALRRWQRDLEERERRLAEGSSAPGDDDRGSRPPAGE
jgi:hypothetical protein